jgi:hypothetical protein
MDCCGMAFCTAWYVAVWTEAGSQALKMLTAATRHSADSATATEGRTRPQQGLPLSAAGALDMGLLLPPGMLRLLPALPLAPLLLLLLSTPAAASLVASFSRLPWRLSSWGMSMAANAVPS